VSPEKRLRASSIGSGCLISRPLPPSGSRQTPSTCVQYCQTAHHEHGATDGSARIDLRGGHGRLGRRGRVATDGYPANHLTASESLRRAGRTRRTRRTRRAGRTVVARRATRTRSVVYIGDTLDAAESRNNSARVGRGRRLMRWGQLNSWSRCRDAMKRRSTMEVGGKALDRVHRRYRERITVYRKKSCNQRPFRRSHRAFQASSLLVRCTRAPSHR
jgi:hypothetical protein